MLNLGADRQLAQIQGSKVEFTWLNYGRRGFVPAGGRGAARSRLPAWLVALLLIPGLILGTSATTYLIGLFSGTEGILPVNGYVFWFGAIWAAVSLVAVALLTTGHALILRSRQT